LLDVHGHWECLVAVAEIHAAPDGGVGEGPTGPLAIWQMDGREGTIFGADFGKHGMKTKGIFFLSGLNGGWATLPHGAARADGLCQDSSGRGEVFRGRGQPAERH
jgi:hypothetical protein